MLTTRMLFTVVIIAAAAFVGFVALMYVAQRALFPG
jgi:hypothetical protein